VPDRYVAAHQRRIGRGSLLAVLVIGVGLAAAAPANAQFKFNTFITSGDATAGWVTDTDAPLGATDQESMQLFVNGTASTDLDDSARAIFSGVPATAPAQPPSFFFKVSTTGASGGSVRLVIRFGSEGLAELRPVVLQPGQWSFVDGASSEWDTRGGTCGVRKQQAYAEVLACRPGADVTGVEVINDSGWLHPGGFTVSVDNISYGGEIVSLAAPAVGNQSINMTQLSGNVIVRVPQAVGGAAPSEGGSAAGSVARISGTASLPLGSVINSTNGRVRVIGKRRKQRQVGRFRAGTFRVRQADDGEMVLTLRGSLDCGATASGASPKAEASARRRRLWGSSSGGDFRTRGRHSSGAVRGTKWLTVDRCNGTLTVVREGIVQVHDYGTGKRVRVRAGRSYFARAVNR
jgi:hypothetical protein